MNAPLTASALQQYRLAIGLLIVTAYVVTGRLGLQLASVNESATPVWPPAGIALAAFLIVGYRVWPAVFFSAFLVNMMTTGLYLSSLLIAVGNTLEGVVGAYLVVRLAKGLRAFERVGDIFRFTLGGAVIAPTIAATVGVATLLVADLASREAAASIWLTWWLGDAVGVILVAPLIILWYCTPRLPRLTDWHLGERAAFVAGLMIVNLIIFGDAFPVLGNRPTGFLIIPFLAWAALRFSIRETATATLLTAGIAVWGTLNGWGPYGRYPVEEGLAIVQAFVGTVALTSLALAAASEENIQTKEKLSKSYDTALEGWSRALDIRDRATEGHAQRVAVLATRLARAMGLSEEDQVKVRRGALLHDIGKISIPDDILFKPGALTEEEWEVMRKHPVYAYDILKDAGLDDAVDIPYAHHERWDGSGYPLKLKGEDIPLFARIFAVVDVFDALRSTRPYRPAMSDSEVFEHLNSLSGVHFDPSVVKAFMELMKKQPDSVLYGSRASARPAD